MAATLPVAAATVCAINNIPVKTNITTLFSAHEAYVLGWMAGIIPATGEADGGANYADLTAAEGVVDAAVKDLFELAYSYKMLSVTAPLLNMNTAGTGIITTTGFEASRTSLLSLDEVKKLQGELEKEALEVIGAYLTDAGITMLNGYQRVNRTRMRVSVIKDDEEVEW